MLSPDDEDEEFPIVENRISSLASFSNVRLLISFSYLIEILSKTLSTNTETVYLHLSYHIILHTFIVSKRGN